MRALITGATGFVGSHLIGYLKSNTDWDIFGLNRNPEALSGPGTSGRNVAFVPADMLDASQVYRAISDVQPDYIIHLAAQAFVPESIDHPATTLTTNVLGQVNLLEAVRAVELKPRILIIGSSDEYGLVRPEDLPVDEDTPFRPTNPYAVSKIAQDMLGLQYHLLHQMDVVRVRPFNHVGPGQSDRFVISSFARQIAMAEAGLAEPAIKVGNLDTARDFTDVRDIVRAYHLAATVGRPGDVYNIGTGRAIQIQAILDSLLNLARVRVSVKQERRMMRATDIPIVVCDSSKFRSITGWEPGISMAQTLRDVLDFWRDRVHVEQVANKAETGSTRKESQG